MAANPSKSSPSRHTVRKALIVGATSAIAHRTAQEFARTGAALFLVGRHEEKLRTIASDLQVRTSAPIKILVADLDDVSLHASILQQAVTAMDGLDTLVVAHGVLGDQSKCEQDFQAAAAVLHTNLISPISFLTAAANFFESQKNGVIAVISSVAGDRGRKSNYVYGTSKAGLSIFLQGLRNRLESSGVTVVTIKPGFVNTPMTAHLKKGALFAEPETIAEGIHNAIRNRKDIVYLPFFWWPIMTIIKLIPEKIFKRLSI